MILDSQSPVGPPLWTPVVNWKDFTSNSDFIYNDY
jgi:hypothetical protein